MVALVNCLTLGCTCRSLQPQEFFGFRDVSAPVGALEVLKPPQKGNVATDVRKVQELLNLVPVADGGQLKPDGTKGLAEDGIVGKFTRGAIVAFQKKQFPDKTADGVVEKSKRTIYRLNVLAYRDVDPALQARGRASVAVAAQYIQSGRHLVKAAQLQSSLTNPLFKNGKAERLLNYHFHLDRSTNRARDLASIDRTLLTMYTASAHVPLGPNQKPAFGYIDTMPPSYKSDPPYAFTFAGGYQYLMGKSLADLLKMLGWKTDPGMATDTRVDQIYLTRRLLDAAPGIIVYAIVHELAHFVGGVRGDIDYIDDKAYWHRQQARYEKLSTYEAMTNADCFAQFCWEAKTGTHFRP